MLRPNEGAPDALLAAALAYQERGWAPIPVQARSKKPFNPDEPKGASWQNLRPGEAEVTRWFTGAAHNIGVLLGAPSGGLVDVDLDDDRAITLADALLPRTPAVFGRESRPRSHRLYVCANAKTLQLKHPERGRMLVELRADGAQTVFPPSTHPSGERVAWNEEGAPAVVDPTTLRAALERLAAGCVLAAAWPGEGGRHDAQLTLCALLARAGWSADENARFVAAVVGAAGGEADYDKRLATAQDAARRLAAGQPLRGYPSLKELIGDASASKVAVWLGGGGLFETPRPSAPTRETTPEPDAAPTNSEEALALAFAECHADGLRYVAAWNRWLTWCGTHWRADETLNVTDLVRDHVRTSATASGLSKRQAAALASYKTVGAVERLARADRRFAATSDQWDSDPWMLATPAGFVDLRTGTRLPSDPLAYARRCTAVAPTEGGAAHPLWSAFLERVTNDDGDLQAFLARIVGYGLTGTTREHALFFFFGTGRNGKGVFLNTIARILGDYAVAAPMATFTEQRHSQHPAELAMLQGARIVTVQETEAGRRWAEARIKQLTGGDPISARLMRQDFFTFAPQFKLCIAGNHQPALRDVDEAIRARMHLIPFTVTIPEDERDPLLAEKLWDEAPSILRWAIEGCLAWREIGLAPPHAVRAATSDYFAQEDAIGLWLEEACERDLQAAASSSDLFESWCAWAVAAGEETGSQKRLSQALEARGFRRKRGARGRIAFAGLRLGARPNKDAVGRVHGRE